MVVGEEGSVVASDLPCCVVDQNLFFCLVFDFRTNKKKKQKKEKGER